MIRNISAVDIPWMVEVCQQRYDMDHYDYIGGLKALIEAMRLETAIAWRDDHSFLVGNTQARAWAPRERTLHILAICVEAGHHWEAVGLLRASIGWARNRGCDKWWIASETEHGVEALARRVGAKAMPGWVVDFKESKYDKRIFWRGRFGNRKPN